MTEYDRHKKRKQVSCTIYVSSYLNVAKKTIKQILRSFTIDILTICSFTGPFESKNRFH